MAENRHAFFAAMDCPTQVTWTNDIQQMFTPLDVEHMKKAKHFDLSNYDDVKIWAVPIYEAVANGSMPQPGFGEGPWPKDKVNTFGCWIKQGYPK
jgi:hypothetical protein